MNKTNGIRIEGEVSQAEDFLREWFNGKDYVIAYTSGSTGIPKEIRLLKSDMIRSAKATCDFFDISERSTMLCPLSTEYIAGKMMVVRAMVSGSKLIIKTPSSRFTEIIEENIDLLPIVPSQINGLLEWSCVNRVRNIIVGGGPVPNSQRQKLIDAPFQSFITYGMTETCSHVALAPIKDEEPVFRALRGITFETDDRKCLVINAPEYTFKRLVVNDVVELIDDVSFVWKGRYDNVIISGGLKFFPENIEKEIEHAIERFKEITGYYIVGEPSEKWGEEVVLVIEAPTGFQIKRLIEEIEKEMPDRRKVPKRIIIKNSFDRTPTGKILRKL